MSSLGYHAALRAFNEQPDVTCERAFLDPALGGVGVGGVEFAALQQCADDGLAQSQAGL